MLLSTRTSMTWAATAALASLSLAACGGGNRYTEQREYLVVETDNTTPMAGSQLAVYRAGIAGVPRIQVVQDPCRFIFNALDLPRPAGYGCELEAPAWSPDGSRLAFVAQPLTSDVSLGPLKLHVAEWDGSQAHGFVALKLPGGSASASANYPAWSPDGRYVVFESADDIWIGDICRPDDEPVQVTSNPAGDSDPTWSRDGKWIAFVSDRGGDDDIWAVGPVASAPTQGGQPFPAPVNWTQTPGVDESLPFFTKIGPSPDSTRGIDRLLFQKNNDLWWIPSGGSAATQITTDGQRKFDAEYVAHNTIAAYVSGQGEIFEIAVQTGNSQRLAGVASNAGFSARQEWLGTVKICP